MWREGVVKFENFDTKMGPSLIIQLCWVLWDTSGYYWSLPAFDCWCFLVIIFWLKVSCIVLWGFHFIIFCFTMCVLLPQFAASACITPSPPLGFPLSCLIYHCLCVLSILKTTTTIVVMVLFNLIAPTPPPTPHPHPTPRKDQKKEAWCLFISMSQIKHNQTLQSAWLQEKHSTEKVHGRCNNISIKWKIWIPYEYEVCVKFCWFARCM